MRERKKRLSKSQFEEAVKDLEVGKQTLNIAYGVLVEGKSQAEFVTLLSVTKGAIWQAVNRVWHAHKKKSPDGFEQITSVLPEYQAYVVKKWLLEAKNRDSKL